jgi:hypothetical protein
MTNAPPALKVRPVAAQRQRLIAVQQRDAAYESEKRIKKLERSIRNHACLMVDKGILSQDDAEFFVRREVSSLRKPRTVLQFFIFDQGLSPDLLTDQCDIYSPGVFPNSLPEQAPELYKNSPRHETILDFLRRVWKPWIDAGLLSRSDLRQLDPKAYTAVYNWLHRNGLPEDLRLPTKREVNDRRLRDEGITTLRMARMVESRLRRGIPVPS